MNMKKLIESMDRIEECGGMDEGGMMPPMGGHEGSPVSMNVSLNASGKDHVADLIDMMKNAGLQQAEPVSAKMLAPRMDMERLRGIVDGPEESIEEGGMKDQLIQAMEKIASDNSGQLLHKALTGAMGPDVENYLQDMYNDIAIDNGLHPDDDHDDIEEKMWDQIEAEYGMGEAYANEPEEEYSDTKTMTKDLSGGINREKKAYAKAQDGDNAMAVEAIKAQLMSALSEKKAKKDYDGDGKIESPKDEYMGSKDKAIKKAMAKKK